MKKIFILFLFCSFWVQAYTQNDLDNVNNLANEGFVNKQISPKNYRLDDPISRAEALKVILRLKWIVVPQNYVCENSFQDTKWEWWICQIVEFSANHGIISRLNKKARPQDPITKAEALAIVMKAAVVEEEWPSYSWGPGEAVLATDIWSWPKWLPDLLAFAVFSNVVNSPNVHNWQTLSREDSVPFYFYPNRNATRADFFGFTKNAKTEFKDITCFGQKLIQLSDEYFKRWSCLYFKTSWAYQDAEMSYVENADSDSFVIIDYLFARDKDTAFKINQGGYISIEVGDNFSTEINKDGNLIVIRNWQKYLADFSTKQLTKI